MKILILGDDSFSGLIIQLIIKNGHNVVACISVNKNEDSDLAGICKKLAVPFIHVQDINCTETENIIKKCNPDIIFSAHFYHILNNNIISLSNIATINIHTSKLPMYKGLSPVENTIRYGEKEIAITIHYITNEVDSGNIILQKNIDININDYLIDVLNNLKKNYSIVIKELLEYFTSKEYQKGGTPQPQVKNLKYYGKIKEQDRYFDNEWTVLKAYNLIRAISYPSLGARYDKYIIWKAQILQECSMYFNGRHTVHNGALYIKLTDGILFISQDDYEILNIKGEHNDT